MSGGTLLGKTCRGIVAKLMDIKLLLYVRMLIIILTGSETSY